MKLVEVVGSVHLEHPINKHFVLRANVEFPEGTDVGRYWEVSKVDFCFLSFDGKPKYDPAMLGPVTNLTPKDGSALYVHTVDVRGLRAIMLQALARLIDGGAL